MSRNLAFEAAHDTWEHRTLSDYLDGEDEPVSLPPVYEDKDGHYRDTVTMRFVSQDEAATTLMDWEANTDWDEKAKANRRLREMGRV